MSSNKRLKLEYTPLSAGATPLVIASFSNGRPASGSALKCKLLKDGNPNRKGRYTLEAETPRVYYSGETNPHAARVEGVYMVGVRERATGLVQMYDASLFRMKSDVKAAEVGQVDNRDVSTAQQQIEARVLLTKEFGGKKKQQAVEAQKRYRVDDSATERARKVGQLTLKETDKMTSDADGDSGRPVPPFNKAATTKDGCYPFDALIGQSEMGELRGPAQLLCKAGSDTIGKWRAKAVYPKFVLDTLELLLHNKLEAKLKQVQVLLYLSCLVKLYVVLKKTAKMSTIAKKTGEFNVPEVLLHSIVDKFTTEAESDRPSEDGVTEKRYRASPFQRDTMISYVLVMAFTIMDFRPISMGTLAADLDLTEKKIKDYFRNVGAKVTSATKDAPATASISLPLTFPVRLGRAM